MHGVSLTCAIFKRFLGTRIGSHFASEGHMNTTKSNWTMELLVKEAQACVLKDAKGNEVL